MGFALRTCIILKLSIYLFCQSMYLCLCFPVIDGMYVAVDAMMGLFLKQVKSHGSGSLVSRHRVVGLMKKIGNQQFYSNQCCTITHMDTSNTDSIGLRIEIANIIEQKFRFAPAAIQVALGTENKQYAHAFVAFHERHHMVKAVRYLRSYIKESELNWRVFAGYGKVMVYYQQCDIDDVITMLIHSGDGLDRLSNCAYPPTREHIQQCLNVDGMYPLNLVLWVDNCQAQTAVKIRLLDKHRQLYASGMSRVELLMNYIGGEEQLGQYMLPIVIALESLLTKSYHLSDHAPDLQVIPMWVVADHHALWTMQRNPGGSSNNRDSFCTGAPAHAWNKLIYIGNSEFAVESHRRIFHELQRAVVRLKAAQESTYADQTEESVDDLLRIAHETIGHVTSIPLLAREQADTNAPPLLSHMRYVPPPLHNNHWVQTTCIGCTLHRVPEDHEQLKQFQKYYRDCSMLNSNGQIAASAYRTREINVKCVEYLEEMLLSCDQVSLRPLEYISRCGVYISQHLNDPNQFTLDLYSRFVFRSVGFLLWHLLRVYDQH